jgi:urease accessory protein
MTMADRRDDLPRSAGELEPLLVALQLGDSFFPSGATSHSWGLEGLSTDGEVAGASGVADFLAGQLEGRWATCDRVALLAAHAAAADLDAVAALDHLVEHSTPVAGWRSSGRRSGRALLATHASLGTPRAAAYSAMVARDEAPGQASVVQGLLAAGAGLGGHEAAALSGYGVAVTIAGAALRLGLIGHLDAQRILAAQRERIARLAAEPAVSVAQMSAWVPAAEIAAMRHEVRKGRLFAS